MDRRHVISRKRSFYRDNHNQRFRLKCQSLVNVFNVINEDIVNWILMHPDNLELANRKRFAERKCFWYTRVLINTSEAN